MENHEYFIKEDVKEVLIKMDIQNGSHVCVQCSDRFCSQVIGGAQAILDVLMEQIGEGGCLFMPTFSYSVLDPACRKDEIPLEEWKKVRDYQLGYDVRLTNAESYGTMANQFLKNEGVIRTSHPVYSFAFWGFVQEKMIGQKNNYPISFSSVLSSFAQEHAVNLLLGVDPKNSVLIPAIAKTLNLGVTKVQRAYVKKGKSNSVRTFLVMKEEAKEVPEILKYCHQKREVLGNESIYLLYLNE